MELLSSRELPLSRDVWSGGSLEYVMRILAVMLMLASVGGGIVNAQTADMLFSGGDILTMRGQAPEYVESLAVKDGTILFAGALADARRHVGPETKTVDLGRRTLLPGFIDTRRYFQQHAGSDGRDVRPRHRRHVATRLDGGNGAQRRAQPEASLHGEARRGGDHRSRRGVGESWPDHGHGGRARTRQRRYRHRARGDRLRLDQIEKMRQYGAIPSFLTAGIIPGGDAVVKLWGPERSAGAMASRTFLRAGLPFTYSHDAPVSPVPSILALVDAGVNRLSGSGQVVGPDERIPPYDALRDVTATAAYQLKEEKMKGTLEPGKRADLVILDRNPLKVEATAIRDIVVVETIKEGRTVFAR